MRISPEITVGQHMFLVGGRDQTRGIGGRGGGLVRGEGRLGWGHRDAEFIAIVDERMVGVETVGAEEIGDGEAVVVGEGPEGVTGTYKISRGGG